MERRMGWRGRSKRVLILLTDAPCHASGRDKAFDAAKQFSRRGTGSVEVIDVGGVGEQDQRRDYVLPDLARIAKAGDGHAFLLTDADAFWQHLIVSVISRQYERDVKELIKRILSEAP